MKIRIKKLKELPDALHPNNISEGFDEIFEIPKEYFNKPTVGKRFWGDLSWSTSGVQEIIDEKTFKTYSSIYEWEIISYVAYNGSAYVAKTSETCFSQDLANTHVKRSGASVHSTAEPLNKTKGGFMIFIIWAVLNLILLFVCVLIGNWVGVIMCSIFLLSIMPIMYFTNKIK